MAPRLCDDVVDEDDDDDDEVEDVLILLMLPLPLRLLRNPLPTSRNAPVTLADDADELNAREVATAEVRKERCRVQLRDEEMTPEARILIEEQLDGDNAEAEHERLDERRDKERRCIC